MKIMLTIFLALTCSAASAQLPAWFTNTFKSKKLDEKYALASYIKPSFLTADFNGDKQPDVAVLITEKKTGSKGILIMHAQTNQHFVFGADGENNYDWLEHWAVHKEKFVEKTEFNDEGDITGSKEVPIKHHGLLIAALMDGEVWAGEVLHWNGKEYESIHVGE